MPKLPGQSARTGCFCGAEVELPHSIKYLRKRSIRISTDKKPSSINYRGHHFMNPTRSPMRKPVLLLLTLVMTVLVLWGCSSGRSTPIQATPIYPTETPLPPFILHIPEKALWNNYLNISAETSAGTSCRLTYVPPMGTTQEMDTIADESGLCTWRFKISEEEGKGPGRLIFTINGTSETHFIEIRRSF